MIKDQRPFYQGVSWGGIVLIILGLIFLLQTLGFVSRDIWNEIFKFWPVILILVGLNIVLNSRK